MRDPAPGTRVKGRVLYVPQAPPPVLPPTLAVHACGTSAAAAHAHGVSAPLPGGGLGGALALCDQESWKQRSALRRTHGDAHTFANANRVWACQMAGGGVPRATSASGEGLGYYHVYRGPAAPPPTLPAPHACAVSHGDSVSPHSRLRASRVPLASLAFARVEVAAGGHGPPQHAPPHPASSHAASASYRPDVWQRPQDVRPVSTVTPGARRAATPAHGHARQRARSAQSAHSVQSVQSAQSVHSVHSLQSHPLHGSLLRRRRRSSWSSGGSCSELLPRPTTSATTTRATAAEAMGEGSAEARSDALTGAREDLRRIALWRHVD